MLNRPELATDKRFLTNAARVSARDELIPLLNEAFQQKNRDEWWEELGGHGFPCGPVRNVKEAYECDQAKARKMALEFDHSVAGHVKVSIQLPVLLLLIQPPFQQRAPQTLNFVKVPAHPAKYSRTPIADGHHAPLLPPPMLGEHTEETLVNLLGMKPSEVGSLEDEGVVSCWRGSSSVDFDFLKHLELPSSSSPMGATAA